MMKKFSDNRRIVAFEETSSGRAIDGRERRGRQARTETLQPTKSVRDALRSYAARREMGLPEVSRNTLRATVGRHEDYRLL